MRAAAGGIVVREFLHFESTRISSPRGVLGAVGVGHQVGIGAGQRGNVARPVPLHRRHFAAVGAQARRQEARQPGAMPEVARQARERHVQRRLLLPGEQFQRGAREDLEGHHGGRGIARQPEEESFRAALAEDQRLARLDQHAVEIEFRAEVRQHLLHDVVFARRDAAREQQQVGLQAAADHFPRVLHAYRARPAALRGMPPARATCAASE